MVRARRSLIGGLLFLSLAGLAACGYSAPAQTSTNSTATIKLSSITVNPASVNGGQPVMATLTLTGPAPNGGAVVSLVASSDSVILPTVNTTVGPIQEFTIPQGATTATFQIKTIPVGSNQTVQITASNQGAGPVFTSLTLIATKPLALSAFTINTSSAPAGQTLIGTIALNAPALSPGQQVFVASSDSSALPQNPVTVPTGSTSIGFSVFTFPLSAQRTVTLTATLNTSTISVQLTLLPSGTAITSLVVTPFTAAGGTSMTGTVSVSPPAPSGGAAVAVSAAFTDTATPITTPLPVTLPKTVTVPAGATTAQFTIMTSKVTKSTGITLTATLGATGVTFAIQIVPALTLAGVTCQATAVTVGNAIACTASLNIPAPAGGQTVMLTSSNPAVFPVPASVLVPAGSPSSPPFSVVAGAVNTPTPITITGTLAGSTTGAVTGTVTIVPIIALNLTSFILSASVVQGGAVAACGSSTGTVLTGSFTIAPAGAPPGGLPVSVTSSDPSVQFCGGNTVIVPQNSMAGMFQMTTTAVASPVTVTITVNVNAFPLKATLSVVPPAQVVGLSISPTSVVGGTSAVGTLTLSVPAPQSGTVVTLQSDMLQAQAPPTVTVTQGNTTAQFAVTTLPVPAQAVTATITATLGASSQQAMLTITPVPPDIQLLYFNPATVFTGRTATGTITLTLPAPAGGLSVSLATNGTAVTVPTSVTVPAGTTSATFTARAMAGITTSTPVQVSGQLNSTAANFLVVLPVPAATVTEQIVAGGETNSSDFPIHAGTGTSPGALPAGDDTGFVSNITLTTPVNGSTTTAYAFSTYVGGMSSFGQVRDVFVDGSGNTFGCGVTMDPRLPVTSSAAQSTYGGGKDAFIAEFNATGTLEYLSYLGGSGDETCNSLVVDPSGNIFVLGSETDSASGTNLTGTNGSFQVHNAGGSDIFVAKLNPATAGHPIWLTFVGGAGNDFGDGRIQLTSRGFPVITGTSHSTGLPPNGFPIPPTQGRPPLNGVDSFGVVVELSADGTALAASTLFFGHVNGANPGTPTTTTASGGLAMDPNNNIYICGHTNASDLPVTTNALQPKLLGQQNAYVAVLTGSVVISQLTYLGGTSSSTIQACKGIAADHDLQPVVVLPTDAADYPVNMGPALNGPSDIAVTKFTHDLSTIIFSRFVGGSGSESADATRLVLDGAENIYFSLATNSVDFPVTANALQGTFAGASGGNNTNVAIVKLSSDGSTILYGSYLGGSMNNSSTSIFYHLD